MTPSAIPNTSGIYRIVCTVTGKLYLGSAINLRKRRAVHFHLLRRKTHHSITLQRAFDKYGEDAFAFEIVEFILPPFLIEREQHWLDILQPFGKKGFNINRVAGSRFGMSPSLATREKLRLANLGKKQSEETIRKRVKSSEGRTHSAETKEAVRLIRLGTKRSPESCERSRLAHLDKKQSEATIEKRRLKQIGRQASEETRKRQSSSQTWRMQTLIVTSPDGVEQTITGVNKFCKEHSLSYSNLINVARGKARHTKGWMVRYP